MPHDLRADTITLAYKKHPIIKELSLSVTNASFTAIIGPNGCGKSTLLRALSRLIKPQSGNVILDGKNIHEMATKDVARRLGLLSQRQQPMESITVFELVARGRFPYQSFFNQWSEADEKAVFNAMTSANVTEFSQRSLSELSGGQSQRAWIAMILAQETPLLLLDEPTTYLDITHQIEILDLMKKLNQQGRTIVTVLHDLNQACRYADHLIAMRDGKIIRQGDPKDIVNENLIKEVFDLSSLIIDDPVTGRPLIIPRLS